MRSDPGQVPGESRLEAIAGAALAADPPTNSAPAAPLDVEPRDAEVLESLVERVEVDGEESPDLVADRADLPRDVPRAVPQPARPGPARRRPRRPEAAPAARAPRRHQQAPRRDRPPPRRDHPGDPTGRPVPDLLLQPRSARAGPVPPDRRPDRGRLLRRELHGEVLGRDAGRDRRPARRRRGRAERMARRSAVIGPDAHPGPGPPRRPSAGRPRCTGPRLAKGRGPRRAMGRAMAPDLVPSPRDAGVIRQGGSPPERRPRRRPPSVLGPSPGRRTSPRGIRGSFTTCRDGRERAFAVSALGGSTARGTIAPGAASCPPQVNGPASPRSSRPAPPGGEPSPAPGHGTRPARPATGERTTRPSGGLCRWPRTGSSPRPSSARSRAPRAGRRGPPRGAAQALRE